MPILMLETRRGSEDGFVVRRFFKDQTYDVVESLARYFIYMGWAVLNPVGCEAAAQDLTQ